MCSLLLIIKFIIISFYDVSVLFDSIKNIFII